MKLEHRVLKDYVRKSTDDAKVQAEYPRVWYLSMFLVVIPSKPGKTRLVGMQQQLLMKHCIAEEPRFVDFTAVGGEIQFREFRIEVYGDIRDMYHQVLTRDDDQHC